jgi:hypothetical protein
MMARYPKQFGASSILRLLGPLSGSSLIEFDRCYFDGCPIGRGGTYFFTRQVSILSSLAERAKPFGLCAAYWSPIQALARITPCSLSELHAKQMSGGLSDVMVEMTKSLDLSRSFFSAGPYFWPAVVSVLGPGILLLSELLIGIAPPAPGTNLPAIRSYTEILADAGPVGGGLLALLGLAAAYGVGFASRTVTFHVVRWLSWLTPQKDFWDGELSRLQAALGESALATVVGRHSLAGWPVKESDALADDQVNWRVFTYCKLWLRSREPILNVDYLEAEINLLFTLILPLVGVAVVVARFVTAAELVQFSLSTLIGAAILLLMWAYVVYSVYRAASSRQRGERRDTLRNFVIGNCYQAADRRTAFL